MGGGVASLPDTSKYKCKRSFNNFIVFYCHTLHYQDLEENIKHIDLISSMKM